MVPLLTLIIFIPLAGAVLIAFLPRENLGLTRWVALITSLISLALSIALAIGFHSSQAGYQFQENVTWIPYFGIDYHVGVDGLGLVLVLLTTLLSSISILYSFGPIKDHVKEYMISFLVLEVGLLGVFTALDLFLFYIFWEIVLVPMYLIIGIWGHDNRVYATLKFVLYTLVGSLLMLVAILATAYAYQVGTGTWTFDLLKLTTYHYSSGLQIFAFLAFFLAFAIKIPMFPFHTWLPDAHVEAPTAGSVVLAGLLLKMGGFGLLRYALPLFPDASHTFAPAIIVLSLIAIIYGAIVAVVQPDFKKLVAYSSVSHMGFVTLGIFVFQPQAMQGAILQMINHGLITGALFLCVGILYERTHNRRFADLGGISAPMPTYAAALGFFMLASAGLPGLSGFVGEFLVFVGTFQVFPVVAAIAAVVMVLGATYLFYMFQQVAFVDLTEFLKGIRDHLHDLTLIEKISLAPLAVLVVFLGVLPAPLLDVLQGPVTGVLQQVAQGTAINLFPFH